MYHAWYTPEHWLHAVVNRILEPCEKMLLYGIAHLRVSQGPACMLRSSRLVAWTCQASSGSRRPAAVVQVATEAQCKAVVLTHFSQRYPKVGKLADVCEGRAAVAFDMMTVDSARLKHNSELLVNVLNKFFSEDAQEEPQEPVAAGVAEGAPQEMVKSAVNIQPAHA